jgi:hypothetical protein
MHRSLVMFTKEANRNFILTHEKQRRNQYTNSKINRKPMASHVESIVEMHNQAQSEQYLPHGNPVDAAGLRPDACLTNYGVAAARHFALGFTLFTSSLRTSLPPISAPTGRTEGAPAVGRAGGRRSGGTSGPPMAS